ncbi:alternate-type signal peptide domain-containing protein [Actinomyces sp. B33]|uniref:alternate-type signal peptide domain-containing protein n=1 Tax=Actinomyces sp. B33 TaxID=2942131 RepID=UPI00233F8E21|nr:alternate-type signal peptide domain-containing protein [Actinomyces sp. B33]MDC4232457.1 alternate-type signal peptide domain-containing protein [Actinomyces sp. B33]
MSRATRAALALTAAAVLIAGSGATFARWYDEASLTSQSVTTGSLRVSPVPDSQHWRINAPDTDETADATLPFDPAVDRIVPGDVVTYTTKVRLGLVGKNLRASLAVLPEGLNDPRAGVTITPTVDCGGANTAALTAADDGAECTVTATIEYPIGTADNSGSALPELNGDGSHGDGWVAAPGQQNEQVAISGFRVVLEQQLRPAQKPFEG